VLRAKDILAQRLCRADVAKIQLVDGDLLTREAVNACPVNEVAAVVRSRVGR
jgi:hypothetical protein